MQFYRFKVTVEKTAVSLISLAIEPEYTELTAGQQMELVAAVSGETTNPTVYLGFRGRKYTKNRAGPCIARV